MGHFKDIEEARGFLIKDRFATANGIELEEVNEDSCICSIKIRDDHRNALGNIMGGVIFTLADLAFAILTNNAHYPTVALDSDIRYLAASKGEKLTAKASLVKTGKTTSTVSISVYDEYDKLIALFTGTGFKL